MTVIEPLDKLFVNHPSSPSARFRIPSSKSTLWMSMTSSESDPPTGRTSVPSALERGRSTFASPPPPTLASDKLPHRPLRNPARRSSGVSTISTKPKPKKRPSTATGARERALPWVGSSTNGGASTTSIAGSSASSLLSTRPRSSLTGTGTVEEVTPWELHPVRATAGRHILSTGPREEVTPWELYPISAPTRNRSSLATGLVEEVTPWELFPVSIPEEPTKSNERRSRSSARSSTSLAPGKSLSDLAQIKRLRHLGGKQTKLRSNTLASPPERSSDLEWGAKDTKGKGLSSSVPTSPEALHQTPTTSGAVRPSATLQNPQFSTADRTILEELKRNISARAAQFTVKGAGIVSGPGIVCPGKKHHPHPREEVPYPKSYDREVLDLDIWETVFCQSLCESLTWHVFETPPTKVLDLGCGTGTWVMNGARSWRNCQFVGLDIVPLHPDLQQVGSPDLASRITWIQANFLEGLPFPNEEFDFVHVKRIALGVPEDKWDFLLEEISRVMKPGGAFEMLEEDLFFPGKLLHSDSDSDSSDGSVGSLSPRSSPRDQAVFEKRHENNATVTHSKHSHNSGGNLPTAPTINTSLGTPSRSGPLGIDASYKEEGVRDEAQGLLPQVYVGHSELAQPKTTENTKVLLSPPRSPDPQLQVKVTSHGHLPYPQHQFKLAASAVSLLLSSVASVSPADQLLDNAYNVKPTARHRGYSVTAPPHLPESDIAQRLQNDFQAATNGPPKAPPTTPHKFSSFLVRTVPEPPVNPRDHSLLESVYTRMLESRFINTSPLALLANSLGLHFKDVRTHAPLQHSFPPMSVKPPSHLDTEYISDTDSAPDSDDTRDTILPSPGPRSIRRHRGSHVFSARGIGSEESEFISEENRFLNIRGLLQHSSRYITLDGTWTPALSPSTKAVTRSVTSAQTGRASKASRLPNAIINFDLKSLNLHLAIRAAEVLACSESMWEWVSEYQTEAENHKASSSITSSRNSILELTRNVFNTLLCNFDMDMRDKYSLSSALEDRLSWSMMPSAPSTERKIFETACQKWDTWEHEQLNASSTRPSRRRPATADGPYSAPQPSFKMKYSSRESEEMKMKTRLSISRGSTLLPPTRQLSRATRVFVAWKA